VETDEDHRRRIAYIFRHAFIFVLRLAVAAAEGGYFKRLQLTAATTPDSELPEWAKLWDASDKITPRHSAYTEEQFREMGGLDDGEFLKLACAWGKYLADGGGDPLPDSLFGCPPLWAWTKYKPACVRAWKAGQADPTAYWHRLPPVGGRCAAHIYVESGARNRRTLPITR
jgi:hypothetical protein